MASTKKTCHSAAKKQRGKPVKPHLSRSCSVLPGPWQLNTAIVFLCILASAVLYAGDLRIGFFRIDDPQYVLGNAWIRGVTWEHIRQILSNPYYLNYSPLHLLSYMLDDAIAGLNAYAFHLSSNLWAGIVAGFVYLVALALTQHRLPAIAAALLFIVHPVHVEAVAWISNRKDLIAAAFVLPSLLAYLKYRQRGAMIWYVVSLLLFLFALLGKLSVVAFPVILLAFDIFLEKRSLGRAIADKIPFVLLATAVAIAVQHAQPGTGMQPDLSMRAQSFVQGLWLLTGLGIYVLYRVPPADGNALAQVAAAIFLLALFFLPLLLRKRYPLVTILIYWMLLTYLPTQILPFTYPVADRYLFLPSIGAVILIAWLLYTATAHLRKWNVAAAMALVAVIGFVWIRKTVDYLAEWQDSRSVWFGAIRKSQDVHVYYELGWEYFEKAGGFGIKRRNPPLPADEAKYYASLVWKDDPRLPQLLGELADNQHNGQLENAFKEYLQAKAAGNFDEAVARRGTHIVPNLFLSRGLFFADKGDMHSAKKEFATALDEASQLPDSDTRQEASIAAHYNLAVAEAGLGQLKEALSWIRLAEGEQDKLGRTVVSELTASRQKLEAKMATLDHN